MEKKLTVVGNSVGFIISRPLLRRLGIGTRKPPPMSAALMHPRDVAEELLDYQLQNEDLKRLTHWKNVLRYRGSTEFPCDEDRPALERMAACLERLRAGRTWEEAISDVIGSA